MRKKKPKLIRNETKPSNQILKLTVNFLPAHCRMETLEEQEYIVVPMVILTEGVHAGSMGPLYYPQEELKKTPEVWNHKPIVVYHPELNGQGISACDPTIINSRKVGIMLNTRFEKGRLRSEAWIRKEQANKVDDRIMAAIEGNEMMELSTGLFVDHEQEAGEWNGESYVAIARNFRPDHLALLPDKIGACSIADGAGFLRNEKAKGEKNYVKLAMDRVLERMGLSDNEMSHDNIRMSISMALREKFNANGEGGPFLFVEDVFSNFAIYELDNKLYRIGYTASDTGVSLSDDAPMEVVRVTEYRTVEGAFVGNQDHQTRTNQNKDMNTKELVDALIANSGYTEEDRKTLEGFTVDQLKLITKNSTPPEKPEEGNNQPAENKEAATKTAAATQNAQPVQNQNDDGKGGSEDPKTTTLQNKGVTVTVEEYIASAPQGIQDVLHNSVSMYNEEKAKLVESIVNHKSNEFSREELQSRPLNELRRIARLASVDTAAVQRSPNYSGMAPVPTENQNVEEAMELPTLSFS